jgi:hypothetical protein
MAISQAMCSSFKSELLGGIHDLDTDVIKIALYTSAATLGASTTTYSATNEVANGNGYTTGGNTLTSPVISLDGTTGIVDFADSTWSAATITARGALIYNSSKANRAIAVLDFGSDKTSTSADFTVVMPAAAAATALIRIA